MRPRTFLVSLAFSLLVSIPHLAHAQSAKLTFFLGQVEARSLNQLAWRVLKLNQSVTQGDTIRTGRESRAEFTFTDGSVMRINERSRMVIKTLMGAGAAQQRGIKVMVGKVWTNAVKLLGAQSTFKVESPTTIAAIRGTIYRMNVEEQTTTEVRVYDGEVAVSPAAPVAPSAPVSPPKPGEVRGPREVQG
ncbi:MAG: FecR domain-containing protein, partial [Candidatus Latescibacteria bacterium]|nr:FecR domain-containing protein [Candidatus Latescibacterota bacterium]